MNFTGNLGRDAETRFLPNGDAVVSFSVALSSGYGEKKITTWLNCSMFGKRGEAVSPYLKKGGQVAISGEFCARPYTAKDGQEKLSLDVRVNDLTLLGGKQNSAASEPARPSENPAQQSAGSFDSFDDDIPFAPHGKRGADVCWRAL